jgi:hypothetical protein
MAVPAGLWKDGNEGAFDVVLGTQWQARRRPTGAVALAAALLVGAVRESGVLGRTPYRVTPRRRALACDYLSGRTDGSEPVPLASACALIGLHPDRVRRAVRRRLGPGDGP